MNYVINGIILGIVQGISEWLPISSKTQIMMTSIYALHLSFNQAYALGLFLEAGTVLAALIYFRREVWGILKALVLRGSKYDYMMLKYIVVITILTGLVGVPLYLTIADSIRGIGIGLPMIALGLILIADSILIAFSRLRYMPRKSLSDLRMWEVAVIGVVQGIAALPGVSRSGVTVSAMLLLGLNPEDSFKLSFISMIPAAIGASIVPALLTKHLFSTLITDVNTYTIITAIVIAALVSIVLIDALIKFARGRHVVVLTALLGALAILSGVLSMVTGLG
ncbi:undecaprenyl-diphosphate phosphatase [Caldivirga maquilingensis]|uniref:undecaprenyl-diphosphate phosphatase n=1 Tax=Caldivirga maquilingensis TaxID=76887 RepID=UPI00064FBF32